MSFLQVWISPFGGQDIVGCHTGSFGRTGNECETDSQSTRGDRDRPATVRVVADATENAPPHSGSALGSASAPGPALRGLSDFQNPSCGVLPPQGASGTSKGVGGLLLREPAGRHVRGTGATGNLAGLALSRGMGGLVRGEDAVQFQEIKTSDLVALRRSFWEGG